MPTALHQAKDSSDKNSLSDETPAILPEALNPKLNEPASSAGSMDFLELTPSLPLEPFEASTLALPTSRVPALG